MSTTFILANCYLMETHEWMMASFSLDIFTVETTDEAGAQALEMDVLRRKAPAKLGGGGGGGLVARAGPVLPQNQYFQSLEEPISGDLSETIGLHASG